MKIYAVKILSMRNEEINYINSLIGSHKRCKIEKFVNTKDKIRALIGEIIIRTEIIESLFIRNEDITIRENQYGKPYLIKSPEFNFNISHSGDFVVCAIDNKPIGIDIEEVKTIEYKAIAKNLFSVIEFNYIIEKDISMQLSKFYEVWTLKESYIKFCGQGLSIPLKSFSFFIDQCESIRLITSNRYKECTFKKFDIELGYKMAVCSLNKEISTRVTMIDQNDLLNKYYSYVWN